MELSDLASLAPTFDTMVPRQKICLFGWFLHVHSGAQTFDSVAIRGCFRALGSVVPEVQIYLPRLADKKPPDLIRERGRYKLEHSVRQALDTKYGQSATVVAVTELLSTLPTKVPDMLESVYLAEALNCYRVQAYRAAAIMTWNLAF